jgi:flagellar hook assembly protein FlgD
MIGRKVNNLVSNQQDAGYKSIQWNATNNLGHPVSAGVYLYRIEAGDFSQTKKMILLK